MAKTKESLQIAYVYAGIITVMAVAQLFTFEDFIEILNSLNVTFGLPALLIASFIVIAEVFALPFLLQIPLSRLFKWVSMVLSWLVGIFWVVIMAQTAFIPLSTSPVLFFGALAVPTGAWAFFLSLGLCVLATWASWGLWPQRETGMIKQKRR